jgi:aryl-alcohol dehydrogenase-like predicted oxidoreductase
MKLGLGCAQFGFDYGISNRVGKPAPKDVARILEAARAGGVQVIDTAHAYGDSEAILGRCWPAKHAFSVVTKTLPLRTSRVTALDTHHVLNAFRLSLERLRQPRIYGLLVHDARDLLAAESERLMDALIDLKERRIVAKLGVSVYDERELDAVLARFSVDIVQVPLSVLDQRMHASGVLGHLKRAGIEVHARSVFLQGILLLEPRALPAFFGPYRHKLKQIHDAARRDGLSVLTLALAFVAAVQHVDVALVGVASVRQLQEILQAWEIRGAPRSDWSALACVDEKLVDPRRWPLSEATARRA